MAKKKQIEVKGTVLEALPSLRFKVELENDDGETREIIAHLSGKMNKYHIRVVPGDTVKIELPNENAERGRITRRL